MARDARGRFLPGPDDDRHTLTKAERQKGYFYATQGPRRVKSSRIQAWLRKKIRRHYQAPKLAAMQRQAAQDIPF